MVMSHCCGARVLLPFHRLAFFELLQTQMPLRPDSFTQSDRRGCPVSREVRVRVRVAVSPGSETLLGVWSWAGELC